MDLTIAIVTNRDYHNFLKPTLDMIELFPNPRGVEYEILVFGPSELNIDDRIDGFYEEKYRQGNLFGYNYLTWMSKGRNIAYLTDDMSFSDNFFEVCPFLDGLTKGIKIAGFDAGGQMTSPFPFRRITRQVSWIEGTVKKIQDIARECHGRRYSTNVPMSRFLAANKTSLNEHMQGYLFHPTLFQGGGDIYLSIWSWLQGEPVIEDIPVRIIPRQPASVTEYRDKDAETVSRLAERLSLGYKNYI
jgi:hypothetical protein